MLDFVGHQRAKFRFDLRYRQMLDRTRRELEADIEQAFPYLPAGCRLELDPVARQIVLDSVRNALPTTWKARVNELRAARRCHPRRIRARERTRPRGRVRQQPQLDRAPSGGRTARGGAGPDEARVGRGLARLLHIDDQARLDAYRRLLSAPQPPVAGDLDAATRRRLEGLLLTLLSPRKGIYASLDHAAGALWEHRALRTELIELLPLLEDRITHLPRPLGVRRGGAPRRSTPPTPGRRSLLPSAPAP